MAEATPISPGGNLPATATSTNNTVGSDAIKVTSTSAGDGPDIVSDSNDVEVQCGPLLNYRRLSDENSSHPKWHGSVLIVTNPGKQPPTLELKCLAAGDSSGGDSHGQTFTGEKLYEDPRCCFWRFAISLPLQDGESKWKYTIPKLKHLTASSGPSFTFAVPAASESMRIMFHSCNGFSVGTDTDFWSGCALWNDVLRQHEQKPIHVMIGGGDQIYNDGIRVNGPLRQWTDIRNPIRRRDFPFDEQMRSDCDDYYLKNYIRWYSTDPFSKANAIIPQINIWDDHDIIDGFGSYTDHFMKCAVFRGIGGVAHKYYLLFQHHVAPPTSTFTTSNKNTMHANASNKDPVQLKDTFVKIEKEHDPSFLFGKRPGPYVEERSRSLYCQLGRHIAFMGIDARTERTRHQINYDDTYDMLFQHASKKLAEANGSIKHFILLLGVPIAYPRLQWLENILSSPIIGPVRFLSKRFGLAGGLFNNFDGSVDLMDDLDDHYTSRHHKRERRALMQRLQILAKEHNVRVTILGGDVHLAALGRFYSNPKLGLSTVQDHRYIVNVVSSAITNKPPPQAVANLLARRNKIHHLDHDTDETLLNLFDKDPSVAADDGVKVDKKSADRNNCTMPSRNYALITESRSHSTANGVPTESTATSQATFKASSNPRNALHAGEDKCGMAHPAASGVTPSGLGGEFGLDVAFRVEISNRDHDGKTLGYGLTIPALEIPQKSG